MKEWPRPYYLIYRVYSPSEKLCHTVLADEDAPLYVGWTDSKKMLKAFMTQRDPNKYSVEKWIFEQEDVEKSGTLLKEWELDTVMLNSNHTKEKVPLITNEIEMHATVRSIKKMFRDQSVICAVDDKVLIAWSIFSQLQEEYKEALHVLGYRQEEEDIIYDSVIDPYSPEAYEIASRHPEEMDDETWFKCILTLESFIKVMEFDM